MSIFQHQQAHMVHRANFGRGQSHARQVQARNQIEGMRPAIKKPNDASKNYNIDMIQEEELPANKIVQEDSPQSL